MKLTRDFIIISVIGLYHSSNIYAKNSTKLNECSTCKVFIKSFQHWVKKTSRGKFEGGDADWEENKLKLYSQSEVRLVEVQEGLCSELSKYKDECYSLAERSEQLIEQWWSENDPDDRDIFTWLCINTRAVCCLPGHFGPVCEHCPENCGVHARCDGDGSRQGSGQCVCARGWRMEDGACVTLNMCRMDSCAPDHFCRSTERKRECLPCDKTCSTCIGPSRKDCTECAYNHVRSYTGSCINTHSPDGKQFPSLVYVLPFVFVSLQFLSKYCKSKYLYFIAFQCIFIAVHYYYGFIHMFFDFIYDLMDYTNVLSFWR